MNTESEALVEEHKSAKHSVSDQKDSYYKNKMTSQTQTNNHELQPEV